MNGSIMADVFRTLGIISILLTLATGLIIYDLLNIHVRQQFTEALSYGLPVYCYSERLNKEVYVDLYELKQGYIKDLKHSMEFPIKACHF